MKMLRRTKSLVEKAGPIFLILAILILVLLPLFAGYSHLANGMVYSDYWQFNYPLRDWYRSLLMDGRFPFWTSLLGNGYPVFAEGQIGALYPPHIILFRLFPTNIAFNLDILLHYFIAFFSTYLFSRKSLKLSFWPSILAGLGYSLSGYFFTHVLFVNTILVVSYLPLIFLLIERIVTKGKLYYALLLSLVFSLALLAGHLELFYYVGAVSVLYFIILLFFAGGKGSALSRWGIPFILLVISATLAFAICIVQLVPTAELVKMSNRSEEYDVEYVTGSRWPLKALGLFVYPGYYEKLSEVKYHPLDTDYVNPYSLYGYLGLIPVIFALSATLLVRKKYVVVFTALLIFGFIYGIGRSTQLFNIVWELVPGMKLLRFPVKILFFLEFCIAVLAAFGFEYFLAKLKEKKLRDKKTLTLISVGIVLLVLLDIYIFTAMRFRKTVKTSDWLSQPASVSVINEGLGDNIFRYYSTNTNNLYTEDIDWKVHKSFQNLMPVNFNLLHDLASNREYFTLFVQSTSKLNDFRGAVDFSDGTLSFPDEFFNSLRLQGTKYILSDLPIDSERLEFVESIDFEKEVAHSVFLAGADKQTVYVPSKGVNIYELEDSLPRVHFVEGVISVGDDKEALEKVLGDDFNPQKDVVLMGEVEKQAKGKPEHEITNFEDREDVVNITIKSESDGYLVLADTYYPGWKAYVDGKETEILKANYGFRAVSLSSGEHNVEFIFRPSNWNKLVIISLVALSVTLSGFLISFWLKK